MVPGTFFCEACFLNGPLLEKASIVIDKLELLILKDKQIGEFLYAFADIILFDVAVGESEMLTRRLLGKKRIAS